MSGATLSRPLRAAAWLAALLLPLAALAQDELTETAQRFRRVKVDVLHQAVKAADALPSLERFCGPLDTTVPGPAEFEESRRRTLAYIDCLQEVEETDFGDALLNPDAFLEVRTMLLQLGDHTCGKSARTGCVPQAFWDGVAEVATERNYRKIRYARERLDALRQRDHPAAYERVKTLSEQTRAAIERHNRRVEEEARERRSAPRQDWQPYAAPVQPTWPVRRDSSTSAPGIK